MDNPQKPQKLKILAVILAALFSVGIITFVFNKFKRVQPISPSVSISEPPKEESCFKKNTGETMNLSEAKEIALKSECVEEGRLKIESFCNQDTGTWWLDLEIEKEGCASACVIDISAKEAEINWRCTGLIP